MKKKIINGILLVAILFAASSAFVSCKDNDADAQTELLGKIANLQSQIEALKTTAGQQGPQGPQGPKGDDGAQGAQGAAGANGADGVTPHIGDNGNWFIGDTDTNVKAQGENGQDGVSPKVEIIDGYWYINGENTNVPAQATFDATDILKRLGDLEEQLKNIPQANLNDYATKQYVDEEIAKIQAQLDEIANKLDTLINGDIYSIEVDYVANPLFGLNTPFDIQSNLLIALYGDAMRTINFVNPLNSEDFVTILKGDKITNEIGNAGKIYLTVNPTSVSFEDKKFALVNTAGQVAPITLSGLQESNYVLNFAGTRGDNGFYEAYATIAPEDLETLQFDYLPEDIEGIKDKIVDVLKQRNKTEIVELAEIVSNIFASNTLEAYRIQATWGNNNHTYSKANIAAISLQPLTYDFDLNDVAEYDDDNITALESLEEYIVNVGTKTQSTRNKIWRFLNRFNEVIAEPILNNVNWAIQPTLLIQEGEEVVHPSAAENAGVFTRFKAGEITLLPTSWTAELVAPAFKKFVAVISIDGNTDPEELAKVNTGNLGKIVDGSVSEIPLTIEADKTYKIQYTAMDYAGRVRNLFYNIKGTK